MTVNPATSAAPSGPADARPCDAGPFDADLAIRWSHPEGERTEHLLVLLHGFGASEHDLFGLAAELPERFTIAAVRAPMTLQPGAFAWFPLSQDPVTGGIGSAAAPVRAAVEQLHRWVGTVRGNFSTVSLLGFSQGMAMATSLLRLDPQAYAATVGLSGFVVDPEGAEAGLGDLFTRDDAVAATKPKLFWGRGQADPIISEPRVESTHAWLTAHVDLMKVVYAGLGHSISPQELGHVREYLEHTVR